MIEKVIDRIKKKKAERETEKERKTEKESTQQQKRAIETETGRSTHTQIHTDKHKAEHTSSPATLDLMMAALFLMQTFFFCRLRPKHPPPTNPALSNVCPESTRQNHREFSQLRWSRSFLNPSPARPLYLSFALTIRM